MICVLTKNAAWDLGLDALRWRFFGPLVFIEVGLLSEPIRWRLAVMWPWHRRDFYDGVCK